MLVVAFLAFKTRKIRMKHFKDTKKVNAFLFMNILLVCVGIPFWWVLRTVNDSSSRIFPYIGFAGIAILCQLLLIAPKVIPPLTRMLFHKTPKKKVRKRSNETVPID